MPGNGEGQDPKTELVDQPSTENPASVLPPSSAESKPKPPDSERTENSFADDDETEDESTGDRTEAKASNPSEEAHRLERLSRYENEIGVLKNQLRRTNNMLQQHSSSFPVSKDMALKSINTLYKLEETLSGMEISISHVVRLDSERMKYMNEFDEIQMRINEAMDLAGKIKSSYDAAWQTPQQPRGTPQVLHQFKLPKFELPPFDGNPLEWASFIDQFDATIHKNPNLADVQKLQFLKSYMRGSALAVVSGFALTEGNYREAYDLLRDRFEDEGEIVTAHLSRLFDLPAMTRENCTQLSSMFDTVSEVTRSLKVLKLPVEHWDAIIVILLIRKLDYNTKKEWLFSTKGNKKLQKLSTFTEFLLARATALKSSMLAGNSQATGSSPKSKSTPQQQSSSQDQNSGQFRCGFCEENHLIFRCPKFKLLAIKERRDAVKRKTSLCFNCLYSGHSADKCPSSKHCGKCNERHHTFLHLDKASEKSPSSHTSIMKPSEQENPVSVPLPGTNVLLSTAVVNVQDCHGQQQQARVLLDSGSQVNLISEKLAAILKLKRRNGNITIDGIGNQSVFTKGLITATISSKQNSPWSTQVECYVLPTVTNDQPQQFYSKEEWPHLSNLPLADENFHRPNAIDLLLGASVFNELLRPGKIIGLPGTPQAINTELGWAVSGEVKNCKSKNISCLTSHVNFDLTRFWAQEEIPDEKTHNSEEVMCEEHFRSNFSRLDDGTYMVKLPFRPHSKALGNSKFQASSRLHHVERRLHKLPEAKHLYFQAIQELIELKHMEKIPKSEITKPVTKIFYLPHHFVTKESSTSTKLRIVFDGSAKSSTGISLNDKLMVGPTIQPELTSTLLRFRLHPIALCADIKMMYKMIRVHPSDVDFLRILWRDSPSEPIEEYRMTHVPFGLSSSPYLAIQTINQLTNDEILNFPIAASVLRTDLYVDDLLSGAAGVEEALELQRQLLGITAAGGFDLCKWSSNHPQLIESLPPSNRETDLPLELDSTDAIKTLGVHWNPANDDFFFKVKIPADLKFTKRSVLSFISKLYDPLGWLQPTVVKSKILMQDIWRSKSKWDEVIPLEIEVQWELYLQQLPNLEKIKIPRLVLPSQYLKIELHGFSDASKKAYGAVVYIRVKLPGEIYISNLLTSKSKVAPIQTVTIPRLELMGALLLSKLMASVEKSILLHSCNGPPPTKHYWTDSTIVLHWLSSHSSKWKEFVSNRVAKIQAMSPAASWNHVRTMDNPADCISRGIYPSELQNHNLWWHGPEWLQHSNLIAIHPFQLDQSTDLEEKNNKSFNCNSVSIQPSLLNKYSSLNTLKRVTAYCYRFLLNFSLPKGRRTLSPLSTSELHLAELHWVRKIQSEEFGAEILAIQNKDVLPRKSKLHSLFPFIDELGILRVGGRIQKSLVPFNRKHPIILPSQHQFTTLILRHFHNSQFHAGPTGTLSQIRGSYWILKGKQTVSRFINKCIKCNRFNASAAQQIMGQLPPSRVQPSRPFLSTGVDFGGPFLLKIPGARPTRARPEITYKTWAALFICMATKAIHLEAVTSLSTEGFLAAFNRFIARRGKPNSLFSDNGTNFEGADNKLKDFYKLRATSEFNTIVSNALTRDGISWKNIPPASPHHGGIWEAGIKSFKFHLCRIVGNSSLTYEEFSTVLCQIEAILNSRPLGAISENPDDFQPLTPGHFLIGGPITAIPEPDIRQTKINRLTRWQLVQQMTQHLWKRWSVDYLSSLQQRPKWKELKKNIKTGDLGLLIKDNLPPLSWKMCRIQKVYPGPDGNVRVVDVKTPDQKIHRRSIVKVLPLRLDNNDVSI